MGIRCSAKCCSAIDGQISVCGNCAAGSIRSSRERQIVIGARTDCLGAAAIEMYRIRDGGYDIQVAGPRRICACNSKYDVRVQLEAGSAA